MVKDEIAKGNIRKDAAKVVAKNKTNPPHPLNGAAVVGITTSLVAMQPA